MKAKVVLLSALFVLTGRAAAAQGKPLAWHNVRGIVMDKIGRPVVAATVYLRDAGSHRLRMKQTDQRGRFNFGPVKLDQSYEIYAEDQNVTSEKLPIRSAPGKEDVVVSLVIGGPH